MSAFWRFITSYPMKVIERCLFVDIVSGNSVMLCQDRHGRYWMAESRWSLFRVERASK